MTGLISLMLASFPLMFASIICGSLSLDESHNWYDILAGATIGILCALAAYRTRYAAIWDFRSVYDIVVDYKSDNHSFNHIPLPRSTFKVIIDDPQQGASSSATNPEKQPIAEPPPRLDPPILPPMSLLPPINERSLPNTPAPSSINVTVQTKSMDGYTNPQVGGMETVIEE